MKLHNLMLAAVAACAFAPAQVFSGTIQIELTGVNINYSDPDGIGLGTGTLTDAGAPADALTAMLFSDDSVPVGTLTSPPDSLTLDLSVLGIPSILVPAPNSSTSVTAPAGGSLTLGVNASDVLDLDLDTVEVVYSRLSVGMFDIRLLFAGSVGSIVGQSLPFGLNIADPVVVSFNLQGTTTESLGYLTSFTGAGTGLLTAPVPEPTSIILVMASVLFAGAICRRQR
jgi:hypothetical protein